MVRGALGSRTRRRQSKLPSPVAALRQLRHGPLKPLDPLWLVLGRLYRATLRVAPAGPVSQRIGTYGPFKMNPTFAFSDFAHWGGGPNRGFAACIERCRDKHCVLDVGAHVGLVTLPASGVMAAGGRLYAFEPAAANARMLEEHLRLNRIDNVELVAALVGARESEAVTFYEDDEPTGLNSVAAGDKRAGFAQTRRRQVSLDGFCLARGLSPEVIKIDVEGGEMDVLEGARTILLRHRPEIFLSVHPAQIEALGQSIEALTDLIDELGYDCHDIEGGPTGALGADEYLLLPRH